MTSIRERGDLENKMETEPGEKKFSDIVGHFEEPLFLISITTFAVTILSFMMGKSMMGFGMLILALLFLGSIYFIYQYHKLGKFNYYFIALPILILIILIFLHKASLQDLSSINGILDFRDYAVFSMIFAIFIFFYALFLHEIIELRISLITAIFISALVLHVAPGISVENYGWTGKYLVALDPYFFYRQAEHIINTGHVMNREILVYPTDPPDLSRYRFFASVFMASVSLIADKFGFTLHDVAMIYAGVFASFTVLVFYLLIRDLFSDFEPYNYSAAILGAFMLMLSPAFATKAIAANCEDDALGMFLMVSSFLLFIISLRRKSFLWSIMAGFSLLLLNLTYSGYIYAIVVLGLFSFLYSLINLIHKRNCAEHIPYFIIAIAISQLHPLILHSPGKLPVFTLPPTLFLASVAVPFFSSLFLEFLRTKIMGGNEKKTKSKDKIMEKERIEMRLERFIEENITLIGISILVLTILFSATILDPIRILNLVVYTIKGARVSEIIGMTTAEQNPLCDNFRINVMGTYPSCINSLVGGNNFSGFGIAIIMGLLMIPVLIYMMVKGHSLGPIFILVWSLPMIWGVINKSQYQFVASVPIVALGSTLGLTIILRRSDLESFRIIPTFLLVAIPLFYSFSGVPLLQPFGGASLMYRAIAGDIRYWYPALEWLKTQPSDTVVLTWWDYGHWIAAVSHRTSILDNTKANRFMVQDIAKFHVLVENESDALRIARKYNATIVMIDYTMIGKAGAPHFIATSGLGGYIPFKAIGVGVKCINGGNCDRLIRGNDRDNGYAHVRIDNDTNKTGFISIDLTSEFVINKTEIDLWSIDGRGYRYRIYASIDGRDWKMIVDKTDKYYSGLQIDKFNDIKARFLKIIPISSSTGDEFRISGIRVYNPRIEGERGGYIHCQFSPRHSILKPRLRVTEDGGIEKVSNVRFFCGGFFILDFEIVGDRISKISAITSEGSVSWDSFQNVNKISILGIHSLRNVLGNALNYGSNNFIDFPTLTTLVAVPEEFSNYMITRLYLGDYLEEYKAIGLALPTIEKPRYFKLIDGFDSYDDYSFLGYVRAYRIIYPESINESISNISNKSEYM